MIPFLFSCVSFFLLSFLVSLLGLLVFSVSRVSSSTIGLVHFTCLDEDAGYLFPGVQLPSF